MSMRVAPVPNIASPEPNLRQVLIDHAKRLNESVQTDGSEPMLAPLILGSYATGDLPDATDYEGAVVYDTTTNQFLYSDGTNWVAPASGSVADADYGDITVTGSGATWTIDPGVVTYAKLQDASASSRILARRTSGAGDYEENTLSQVLDFVGSPADGDILYRTGGAWTRLGAGSNGNVLTLAAGVPTWAAGTAPWTLIAQNVAPGTVAQVNFNQAAIATSTELLLVFEAVTVSGSLSPRIAVSTDAGSTFANISVQRLQGTSSGTEQRNAFIDPTLAENNGKQGSCHIICPPGGFKRITAHASRTAAANFNGWAHGIVETTSTIDYVRFLTSTSTITGGNFRLYGK